MTEGAPADFAGHEDVAARWRPFRNTAEQAKAVVRLGDASSLLRTLMSDIDERIAADDAKAVAENTADPEGHGRLYRVAKAKVADAVVRYMDNPRGAKQLQQTIGPRTLGITLPDGGTLGIFFTEEELKALQPTAGTGSIVIGTTFASFRPGWGPHEPRRTPGWWPTS